MNSSSRAPVLTPSTAGAVKHRRRLRNFLINRGYQMRYVVAFATVGIALTAVLGGLMYYFHREASQVVAVRALDPTDPLAPQLQQEMLHNDRMLLVALVGFGVLLVVVLAGGGLVLTHRVAGPLFKISAYMHSIEMGKLGKIYDLRRGDELADFFAIFRAMHVSIEKRTREELLALGALADKLEAAGHKEAAADLRAMQRKKEEFLT